MILECILYPVSNILIDDELSKGSLYPRGPYIGFPSYAHPTIGECSPGSSLNSSWPIWVEYPTTEYFKWSLDGNSVTSWYFWSYGLDVWIPTKFSFVIDELNTAFFPLSVILMLVWLKSYPIPLFKITTLIIFK